MSDPAEPTPTPTPEPTPPPTPEPPAPEAPKEPESLLGAPPAPEAPEPFDPEKLVLPEGFEKNEVFEEFTNVARETGLTGVAAQRLFDLHQKIVASASERISAEFNAQNEKWINEVKADSEIGGDKFDGIRQTFSKVADNPELSDPKFREALVFTGAGNNPAIVRTLARWAKALTEGGSVAGGPPARDGQGSLSAPPSLGVAIYGPNGPHTGGPKLS